MLEINKKYPWLVLSLCSLLICVFPAWAIYQSSTFGNRSGVAAGGGSGFVGTKTQPYASAGYFGNGTFTSPFVATTTGNVSYIYYDPGTATINLAWVKPAIYDASLNLLAYATDCTGTTISGTLTRFTLNTTIGVTASTTYRLGYAVGDTDFQLYHNNDSGTIYEDTTVYTGSECPASVTDPISDDATRSSDGSITIWATNNASDSY